jgi:aconitate hydratase
MLNSVYQPMSIGNKTYYYYSLKHINVPEFAQLPFSLKILLENILRNSNASMPSDIEAMKTWLQTRTSTHEIAYAPARVLMQDFTGVPAVVDLAAMRDAMKKLGGNVNKVNPLIPVDLVIDHSVQVDSFASHHAFHRNVELEMSRNAERYEFLRWGQKAFKNFRVVPPGTGICHQVNLEYLAKAVWQKQLDDGSTVIYPDTLVGTDSHTTMINGLGVLGWGVGGIEAEAAMLGQPISMVIPEVIGVRLVGKLKEGVVATDLVLTLTEMLRKYGVVGKFVEYFGQGLAELPLADRATIANMAPEYGATCGFFPIDEETLKYMHLSGRDEETLSIVEAYCKAQGLWRDETSPEPIFTDILELDLSTVVPSLAGPRRPQDRVSLDKVHSVFDKEFSSFNKTGNINDSFAVEKTDYTLSHGDVVIAAITSCTNTSNPSVLIAAGLLAKKAIEKGLTRKPWVKTSLAPGSKVVTEYLQKAGLQKALDTLGFDLVGYGCTTCIGNSGPLPAHIEKAITDNDLVAASVLSGNRNFEGRVHPFVKTNWLASPPLVVAYALAGTTRLNLHTDPLGYTQQGDAVYLKDIWPSNHEVASVVAQTLSHEMFRKEYDDVFAGDKAWQAIPVTESQTYAWNASSTYIQNPPYFVGMEKTKTPIKPIENANILALLGDSITTDHISPAGSIKADSPAGKYLQAHGVSVQDFNSYGARRGNHEVMMRGTFANIRIRNEMLQGVEGGFTRYIPTDEIMSIYDAAMRYQAEHKTLVIIAGKEYGTGSSRDWAAKGTLLLGVKAVITESFERIHRSNLVGMGILPLEFTEGQTRKTLGLTGDETVTILGMNDLEPRSLMTALIKKPDGQTLTISLRCRIDTDEEMEYMQNGGILQYVLRNLQ